MNEQEPFPYRGNLTWLQDATILLVTHGSHAYGLSTPTSDLDIKGVCIPPPAYFHGFLKRFEQAEAKEPDLVIYEVRKFFGLAADCNPNIIEVLWTDASDHRLVTEAGRRLLDARKLFLSRKARHTFAGYAHAQLRRIQLHHRWLKNPPTSRPTRSEYGLPERTVIPQDQLAAAQAAITKKLATWQLDDMTDLDPAARIAIHNAMTEMLAEMKLSADDTYRAAARSLGYDENFIRLLDLERQYLSRQREFEQYESWKTHRNPARAALEARYGYDTKHASHLVRLMRMCREILETGEVVVKRPDAEELRAIRGGAWDYERLVAWAAEQDASLDEVARRSPLPHAPDREALDALCVDLVEAHLSSRR